MAMQVLPAPPGTQVTFDAPTGRPRPQISPDTIFMVGIMERGTVGAVGSLTEAADMFGGHLDTSPAPDALAALLAAGVRSVVVSPVWGPEAKAAAFEITGSIRVEAASPGEWGNQLKIVVLDASADIQDGIRLQVLSGSGPVATSPACATVPQLVEWTDRQNWVTITAVGTSMPAPAAAEPLVGGSTDRANIGADQWQDATLKLVPNYGPGFLVAPGLTDPQVQKVVIKQCAQTNRRARLETQIDATEQEIITHAQTLIADLDPADREYGALFANHEVVMPVAGQPERIVSSAVIDAAIASRVLRADGVGSAPFGIARGIHTSTLRLRRQWSSLPHPGGEVQRLYAAHVNTPEDKASTIVSFGYRTLSDDRVLEDLHGATIRMALAWEGQQILDGMIGQPADRKTLASLAGRLDALCATYAENRAFNTDQDDGYLIVIDELNTPQTLADRQLHAGIRYRPAGSVHWSDLVISATSADTNL